jgi:hypothetical protein
MGGLDDLFDREDDSSSFEGLLWKWLLQSSGT